MRGVRIGLAISLLVGVPLLARGSVPLEIAVLEFSSDGKVSEKQMAALEDLLATEIRRLGEYRVIGKRDILNMLRLEQKKALMGCADDSCVAEIGGALGVRWLVFGNIGVFGKTYLFNVKLMDAERVRVASSVSQTIKGGEEGLIEALPGMVSELFSRGGLEADARPGAAADGAAPWGHVCLWSGVGLAAFGGVALWQAMDAGDAYDAGGKRADLTRSRAWSGTMWAGFGLGAALIATGTALLIRDAGPPATAAAVAPMPDGSGLVFSVGGRW